MSLSPMQNLNRSLGKASDLLFKTARSLRTHGVRHTHSLIWKRLKRNPHLTSHICWQEDLESPVYETWAKKLAWGYRSVEHSWMHRKLWEWCFISNVLDNFGLLSPGHRGLGFAVGTEPMAAAFCGMGASIVASDLGLDEAKEQGWVHTDQHAADLDALNSRGLCPPDQFRKNCEFRYVDMNQIPDDLTDFDFVWSSCSMEHLGSLTHGENFLYRAMDCLKPGGIAVHTTEYNCYSNRDTIETGGTVLYRRKDIERMVANLQKNGHHIDVDFRSGTLPNDNIVDTPPYKGDPHLKLLLGQYVITSIGLVIQKAK